MARVHLVQTEDAPPEVKEVYRKIEANGARLINLYRVAANSPNILLNLIRLGNSIVGRMALSPKVREMVILRVARLTGSDYEWAQHTAVGLQAGLTQAQIDAVGDWRRSDSFDERERAVLRYVDQLEKKVKTTDRAFNSLKKHFNEQEIVEITLTAGFYGMLARLLVSLEVDIDAGVGSASDLTGRRKH